MYFDETFVSITGGKGNEKTKKHGKLGKNLYLCGEKNNTIRL